MHIHHGALCLCSWKHLERLLTINVLSERCRAHLPFRGGIPWGLGDSGMEEVAFEHLYFDKVVFELLV